MLLLLITLLSWLKSDLPLLVAFPSCRVVYPKLMWHMGSQNFLYKAVERTSAACRLCTGVTYKQKWHVFLASCKEWNL